MSDRTRSIKFRAWNKKAGEWHNASSDSELALHGFHIFGEATLFNYPRCVDLVDLEITQFTGLTDRNGVDIYEGDIVTGKKPARNSPRTGVVTYKPMKFFIDCKGEHLMRLTGMEVIGNIYQHRDLLTEDQ